MFTGIVLDVGRVTAIARKNRALRFAITSNHVSSLLAVDDSVSVSGVCLTVVACSGTQFQVEAVEETLNKTSLGKLKVGDLVNLEPAVRVSDRLGGHLVQGHVDAAGMVEAIEKQEGGLLMEISLPEHLLKYVISEGSITIDGVSLTVARLAGRIITLSLIPHTLEKTTLSARRIGDPVNIEVDVLGKYIERLLTHKPADSISESWVKKMGYE